MNGSSWLDALPRDRLLAEVSLWSADLGRLADDVARVDPFTDIYHLDVADGHFAPAMLFFPDLVAAVRKLTAKPLHMHLMVQDAILLEQIDQFAAAGGDLMSVHLENGRIGEALESIAQRGLLAGLVAQLDTPVDAVRPYIDRISSFTLLGTKIGVKGKGLDPSAEPRMREARALLATRRTGRRMLLAADGGIRATTVPGLRRAGAETIVMGSLAFGDPDLPGRIGWVHAQVMEA